MGLSAHAQAVANDPKYSQLRQQILESQKKTKAKIEAERAATRKPGEIAGLSAHSKIVAADPKYAQLRQQILESQKKTKAKIAATTRKPGEIAGLSAHSKAVAADPKYATLRKQILKSQAATKAKIEAQRAATRKAGEIGGLSAHSKAVAADPVYQAAREVIEAQQKAGAERVKLEKQGIIQTPPLATTEAKAALEKMKKYQVQPGYIDVKGYLKDEGGKGIATLREAGYTWETLQNVSGQTLAEAEAAHKQATTPIHSQIWQGMTPWDEAAGETASAAGVGIMAAEILVPGVYTARHWSEMSPAERAFSIGMDVLSIIPAAGAATKGARAVGTAGRGARLAGAAKGIGREAIAQVRAPIDVVIHPIATGKAAAKSVRNLAEDLAHPGKIPEAVLTTSDGAVRIRVGKDMSELEALAARDKLMSIAQQKGTKPIIEIGGQKVELTRSAFMKEAGGLVHATPDIEILEAARIKTKPGLPDREQGWFLSHEPSVDFTRRSAHGLGEIPVPGKAGGKVVDIGKYRPNELVYLDKAPIRPLDLADAINVPDALADPLMAYIKQNDGVIYGSLNEWVKIKKAIKPNDIDVIFKDSTKALKDFMAIAEKNGFKSRKVPHGVEIFKDGEWVKLADIASEAGHAQMSPLPKAVNYVDGIQMETLGKQYISQAYGSVAKTAKAPIRAKKLNIAADDIKKIIKEAGITEKKPGIYVISPESSQKAVSTQKLFKSWDDGLVAEMEKKIKVGEFAPKVKQKLFTRLAPDNQKVAIYMEKPLSKKQILKLKGMATIENMKAPFKPAIKLSKADEAAGAVRATNKEMDEIIDALKASGNIDQANELRRVQRAAIRERTAPRSLYSVVGRVAVRKAAEGKAGSREKAPREETPREETPDDRTPRPGKPDDRTPRTPKPDDRTPRPGKPDDRTPRPGTKEPPAKAPRVARGTTPARRVADTEAKSKTSRVPMLRPTVDQKTGRVQAPRGSVTHAQGIGWWTYYPPFGSNDRIFSREKPTGARVVASASKAMDTIQSIGGKTVVNRKFDMGIMDVNVGKPPVKPSPQKGKKEITFKRDTEGTYGALRRTNKSQKRGAYHYKDGKVSRKPIE